jgi:hypothetical protein
VIWHDVKVNVSAWLTLENAALPASNAAPAKPTRDEKLFMMTSIQGMQTAAKATSYILNQKHCQSFDNFLNLQKRWEDPKNRGFGRSKRTPRPRTMFSVGTPTCFAGLLKPANTEL